MLQIEFAGKTITTTDKKQEIVINGNPVEIERVGDSIYVNQTAINLIVVDEKNRWKSVLFLGILIPAVAGILYLVATNQALLERGGDAVVDFVQNEAIPTIEQTIDTVDGYVNGNEKQPTAIPSGE